jgi:hypothetical protein
MYPWRWSGLEADEDADAVGDVPILVITDGECDLVRVRREHAFLVPAGARLPFTPKGSGVPGAVGNTCGRGGHYLT